MCIVVNKFRSVKLQGDITLCLEKNPANKNIDVRLL
jgi:hypothetical protein